MNYLTRFLGFAVVSALILPLLGGFAGITFAGSFAGALVSGLFFTLAYKGLDCVKDYGLGGDKKEANPTTDLVLGFVGSGLIVFVGNLVAGALKLGLTATSPLGFGLALLLLFGTYKLTSQSGQ